MEVNNAIHREPVIGEFAEGLLAATPECACNRCGDMFRPAFFVICGGCLADMELTKRGLPPIHLNLTKAAGGAA